MPWQDVRVNGHAADDRGDDHGDEHDDGRGDDRDVVGEERQMGVVSLEEGLTCDGEYGSEM